MKKILISILVASIFFIVSATAQDRNGRGEKMKQYLTDSLGVSEVNADSVVVLSQQSMVQIREIMKDQSLSQDEKKEKMKPLRDDMKTKMKKFLTDDQIAKLQQMEMERRQNRNGR